eukprot:2889567-Rhodomonas_salina.3
MTRDAGACRRAEHARCCQRRTSQRELQRTHARTHAHACSSDTHVIVVAAAAAAAVCVQSGMQALLATMAANRFCAVTLPAFVPLNQVRLPLPLHALRTRCATEMQYAVRTLHALCGTAVQYADTHPRRCAVLNARMAVPGGAGGGAAHAQHAPQ